MTIIKKTQLTATELDTVSAIWLDGNLSGHPFIASTYWREQQPLVRKQLAQTPLLVALIDNQIVGFLGLQGSYIAGIFVAAAYRDQGIGGQLLTAAQADQPELTLAVYHQNIRAVAFYVRHGFHRLTSEVEAATGARFDTLIWKKPDKDLL